MSNSELPASPVFNLFGEFRNINSLVDRHFDHQAPELEGRLRQMSATMASFMISTIVSTPETDLGKIRQEWETTIGQTTGEAFYSLFNEAARATFSVLRLVEHQPEYQPGSLAYESLKDELYQMPESS